MPSTLPNLLSGSRCYHICTQSLHLQEDRLVRWLMAKTLLVVECFFFFLILLLATTLRPVEQSRLTTNKGTLAES